jgi:hypothetical protein
MRVRIRRLTKNGTDILALDFPPSRTAGGSALCEIPAGFTHFDLTGVSLSRIFGFLLSPPNCSSYSSSRCSALPSQGGTMASADPCRLNLTSRSGLLSKPDNRSPQVRTLTFPAPWPGLPLWPLTALDFVVICQLVRPHGLLPGSCSSRRSFASSFLQTPPHSDALALG